MIYLSYGENYLVQENIWQNNTSLSKIISAFEFSNSTIKNCIFIDNRIEFTDGGKLF